MKNHSEKNSILPLFHLPQSIVKLVLNIYNCIVCHIDPGTEANHEDEAGQTGPGGAEDGWRPGGGVDKFPGQSQEEEWEEEQEDDDWIVP